MPTFHIQQPAMPGNSSVVNATTPLPSLLTQKEVCAALRVSRSTLAIMIQSGKLQAPIRLTPRKALFRKSDLISLLS